MPLAPWQTESAVEPEVADCVEQICIGVSCIAPVTESLAIIEEMELYQRALWETEALREAKERRLKQERRQRARLKLERSRQELEDRVRRRQEARREERGVRAAAPMVVMRRSKQSSGGGGGGSSGGSNPNTGPAFHVHRESAAATAAHLQSRLPFTGAAGVSAQHGAPPGMRPPSRERNVATMDLGGSLDQSLASLRAQALAMAQDAGFTPAEMAEVLPEMNGGNGNGGKGLGRGSWSMNAEPNQARLSAALARLQAAQHDLGLTPDQLRQQKLLELHSRGGVFTRSTPAESADGGMLTLTPRTLGAGEPGGVRDNSGARSGREILMESGVDPAAAVRSSADDGAGRRAGAMMGRGRSRGGSGRGARYKNGAVKGARSVVIPGTGAEYGLTSTSYPGSGAEDAGSGSTLQQHLPHRHSGRELLQQQAQRRSSGGGQHDPRIPAARDKQRPEFQGAGSGPGSGRENMHDPVWKIDTNDDPAALEAATTASALAVREAQKREELYRIQQENNRLRRDLEGTADRSGDERQDHAAVGTNAVPGSPVPHAESISGSPFYQFRTQPSQADAGSPQGASLPGASALGQNRAASGSGSDGDTAAFDGSHRHSNDSRRPSSSDSDGSDMDGSLSQKAAFAAPVGGVAVGRIRPGSDVAKVRGARGHDEAPSIDPNRGAPSGGASGAGAREGAAPAPEPKRLTAAEARASTRGNWHGIRGLLAEHGAIGVDGHGLTAATDGEGPDVSSSGGSADESGGGSGRYQHHDNRAELDTHSHVQKRLGDIHSMVLDSVRWEKKKERRAEARDERKSTFRSASLDVASRAFERGRPDLLYSSQFR